MQNCRNGEEISGSQGLGKGEGGESGYGHKTATRGMLVGWECSVL